MSATTAISNGPSLVQHKRKSQVFVDIPPSPLLKSRAAATSSKVDEPSASHKQESHKENAVPLSAKTSMNNIPTDSNGKGKRKLQDEEDQVTSSNKKAKIPKVDKDDTLIGCHQCRSKKSSNLVLQCTRNLKTTGKRCKASYCDTCLRTRYGEQLQAITKRKLPQSREAHDPDTDYDFTCPRCDGHCNCAPCRKKKGLAPVGKFTSTQGGESVRQILEKNPQASGLLPKHTVIPVPNPSKSPKAGSSKNAAAEKNSAMSKKKSKANTNSEKNRLKIVPEPVWVPVPQVGTKQEIEDRIYLREFILRFNPILNIGLKNLEDLDDFTSLHDQSTKSMLIALLDLIAIEDDVQKKRIQGSVKKIRGLGLNWTKIVPVLYELRKSLPGTHALSSLPDVNESDLEVSHNTRGTRMQGLHADQLLPVLLYLVDIASDGASVRQELEEGNKQVKDVRAAYFKAQRAETERWATEKTALAEEKTEGEKKGKTKWDANTWKAKHRKAESEHKAIVSDIQNSHKPEIDACASRFMPLGRDPEGRTYYALSACGPQRNKKERLPSDGERSSMKRWGWFIAVYGKPGAVQQERDEDAMDQDEDPEDPNAKRWWAFTDILEMQKLSKWLAHRAETVMQGKKAGGKKSTSTDDKQRAAATAAVSSTLTSLTPTSRPSTPLKTADVSEAGSRPPSPLFDLSASDSEEEIENEMDVYNTNDDEDRTDMSQPATQTSLKALAKGVLEFADFIDWRLRRDETLAKGRNDNAIITGRFYQS